MTCEIEADSLSEHPGSWHATTEASARRDPTFQWMSGSAGLPCLETLVLLLLIDEAGVSFFSSKLYQNEVN